MAKAAAHRGSVTDNMRGRRIGVAGKRIGNRAESVRRESKAKQRQYTPDTAKAWGVGWCSKRGAGITRTA
jgi:hypothetical protein